MPLKLWRIPDLSTSVHAGCRSQPSGGIAVAEEPGKLPISRKGRGPPLRMSHSAISSHCVSGRGF